MSPLSEEFHARFSVMVKIRVGENPAGQGVLIKFFHSRHFTLFLTSILMPFNRFAAILIPF
jgi:hypothetical protein